jgi:hypothetical protein
VDRQRIRQNFERELAVPRYGPVIAGDEERVLSHSTKLIIAGTVFTLGVFAGAAIAAWIVPPS